MALYILMVKTVTEKTPIAMGSFIEKVQPLDDQSELLNDQAEPVDD